MPDLYTSLMNDNHEKNPLKAWNQG